MIIKSALVCLALNVYFEARNQPVMGQIAVSQVVLNRVRSPAYPDSICAVVKQAKYTRSGKLIRHKCQFSWYCDGKSDQPTDLSAYRWARYIALLVLYRGYPDLVDGATHYHSLSVDPEWNKRKQPLGIIGDHIFFK